MDTKEEYLDEESVSKVDQEMDDGSDKMPEKTDPIIVLLNTIFDHSNNRLTRVEMFSNLLI